MTTVPAKRRRSRRETVNPHELNKAIGRVRQYKQAELSKQLDQTGPAKQLDKFLTKYSISRNTLNTWLEDPRRAKTAYKAPYLLHALRELPPLTKQKAHQAYRLLLRELGIPDGH